MPLAAPLLETRLNGLAPHRQGKVRDILRRRRRAADRRHRSHLGVRLRARLRHSRQGQGADAAVGVLVRADAATSCRTTCSTPTCATYPAGPAPARRHAARAARCSCARRRPVPDRVRGARLPVGLGLEGLPGDRRGLRRRAAAGPARIRPAARADLHAGDQGRRAATTSTSAKPRRRDSSAPTLIATLRDADAGALRAARRTPSARHHPRRHEVRVRPDRRRRASC